MPAARGEDMDLMKVLLRKFGEDGSQSTQVVTEADSPSTTEVDSDQLGLTMSSAVQKFLMGAADDGDEDEFGCGPSEQDNIIPSEPEEIQRPPEARPVSPVPAPAPAPAPDPVSNPADRGFLTVLRNRDLHTDMHDAAVQRKALDDLAVVLSECYRDRQLPDQDVLKQLLKNRGWTHGMSKSVLAFCARHEEQFRILPPQGMQKPVVLLVKDPVWFSGWTAYEC